MVCYILYICQSDIWKVYFYFLQLRECESQVLMRDSKIKELKLQVETAREGEAKSTALVATFQQRLAEFEASHGTLEGAASRSELAVQTLSKQNAELQERILDLESRARYVG